MLDVITCSTSFFKCISDCGVIPYRVRSDHSAIIMVFLNRSIKFKSNFVEHPVIDWKGIQRPPELNEKLNLILQFKLKHPHNYTSYNAAILSCAEDTALVAKGKYDGWYYHSQETLTPTLAARNELLYAMRGTKLSPSSQTLDKIKRLQWEVDEVIAMAKTCWSRQLVKVIHKMSFRPKEAWSNINMLCKG